MPRTLISIVGPSAVGKTTISLSLAKDIASEIVSCDARQFYRELKIGTASPDKEILQRVKHHFIGHLSIHQNYTAGDFQRDALEKLNELFTRYSTVIMVGGSGLYEKAVTQGLDIFPKVPLKIQETLCRVFSEEGIKPLQRELEHSDPSYYQKIDIHNPRRLIRALGVIRSNQRTFSSFLNREKIERNFRLIKVGLYLPLEKLYLRINARVDQMMRKGLLEEAKIYHPYKHLNSLQTVGYKELFAYFEGLSTLKNVIEEIKKNTRRYAKRQLTWYRKEEEVNWFLPNEYKKILTRIKDFIGSKNI